MGSVTWAVSAVPLFFFPGALTVTRMCHSPGLQPEGLGRAGPCGQGATRCFPQPSVPEALNPAGELGPKRARHGLRELGNATELMIFNIRIMKPS